MAVVWPSPLVTLTATPGICDTSCEGCVGFTSSMDFAPMTPTDAGVSLNGTFSRVPVTWTGGNTVSAATTVDGAPPIAAASAVAAADPAGAAADVAVARAEGAAAVDDGAAAAD